MTLYYEPKDKKRATLKKAMVMVVTQDLRANGLTTEDVKDYTKLVSRLNRRTDPGNKHQKEDYARIEYIRILKHFLLISYSNKVPNYQCLENGAEGEYLT